LIAALCNAVGRAEPAAGTSDLKIGSGDLALVLGANPSPAAQRAGELFAKRAQGTSSAVMCVCGEASRARSLCSCTAPPSNGRSL